MKKTFRLDIFLICQLRPVGVNDTGVARCVANIKFKTLKWPKLDNQGSDEDD